MKMKFIETSNEKNSLNKARFLISHPNYSGLQFNQLTRAEIPAHFINYVKVEQDGGSTNSTALNAVTSKSKSFGDPHCPIAM